MLTVTGSSAQLALRSSAVLLLSPDLQEEGMASVNGGRDLQVRVVSRRLVKAADSSIKPHVLHLSNLDLLMQNIRSTAFCIYPKPSTGVSFDFDAVVHAFESGLPSFLNHFFPFAGRIATNPSSGLPEVVSFACGGFTVAWCSLVGAWSELARSGTLAAGSQPNLDRSVFRPRSPPAYGASLDEAFTPLDGKHQVNALTANQSFVERLYYIDASDLERLCAAASRREDGGPRATRVQALSAYLWKALAGLVGAADEHCRMGWRVDGRERIASDDPKRRAAMRSYVGNLITYVVGEASVREVMRMPLPEVAAMLREAINAAPAYEERFQEVVDWVEEHKSQRYVETAILGLGSPILSVTALASFTSRNDITDFGFGHAAMAVPTATATARLCSGYVQVFSRPGDDGTWFVNALVWPQLAAALEADEPRVLRPVTAECLGLSSASLQVQRCRL
ncbi:hypothetical protein HU200_021143 [Digitaria exilis]|uniref:Uncharacterized protein n=1 Tax=Digitaria exilis TaxID=1010633 RepID=A0A835F023_9POAL|nr:hypothetical protein HU200_021143 [Digitaria exilis]